LPFFEIGLIQSGNIGKTVKIVDNWKWKFQRMNAQKC
jgi:hypothetical protein